MFSIKRVRALWNLFTKQIKKKNTLFAALHARGTTNKG